MTILWQCFLLFWRKKERQSRHHHCGQRREVYFTLALRCFPLGINLDVTHLLVSDAQSILNKGQSWDVPSFNGCVEELLDKSTNYYVWVKILENLLGFFVHSSLGRHVVICHLVFTPAHLFKNVTFLQQSRTQSGIKSS